MGSGFEGCVQILRTLQWQALELDAQGQGGTLRLCDIRDIARSRNILKSCESREHGQQLFEQVHSFRGETCVQVDRAGDVPTRL